MLRPPIQWYPGHIAKAEQGLKSQLKRVDVVLEVRDCRILQASAHPDVPRWIGNKPWLLVCNRMDMIPLHLRQAWENWFLETQEITPYFTDAQHGKGVIQLLNAAKKAGIAMNERRSNRGLQPRPVRAVVIGFPNVGKSALINRLLNRKVVSSERRPGVTRQLRWVRISEQIELLDAPGVIPSRLEDQVAAVKLAICDDIGQAAYDNQRVAAALVELLNELDLGNVLKGRYRIATEDLSGEDYICQLAQRRHRNDLERAARQLLDDFRRGDLGNISLEIPPPV
ncbi:MAG: ribosome biogenesis GTPase YlqF [Cyanobacteria bacterium P01_H01_bin.15]